MKLHKIFIALLLSATVLTACDEYEDVVVPGPEVPAGIVGAHFSLLNKTVFELDPSNELVIPLKVVRSNTQAAAQVAVSVVKNEGEHFVIPATVSFAAGDSVAILNVTAKTTAPTGVTLPFEIKLDDAAVDIYSYAGSYGIFTGKVSIIKWNNLGEVAFYDNFVFMLNADNKFAKMVTLQQRDDKPEIYRINYPYSEDILVAADWVGWTGGSTQANILFTVDAKDLVTWEGGFWYTSLLYQGGAGQDIKAYHPTARNSDGAENCKVVRDDDGNIRYMSLTPIYYIDGLGGFGANQVYLAFPGFDLIGALGLKVL
jgi:hypothetical protein